MTHTTPPLPIFSASFITLTAIPLQRPAVTTQDHPYPPSFLYVSSTKIFKFGPPASYSGSTDPQLRHWGTIQPCNSTEPSNLCWPPGKFSFMSFISMNFHGCLHLYTFAANPLSLLTYLFIGIHSRGYACLLQHHLGTRDPLGLLGFRGDKSHHAVSGLPLQLPDPRQSPVQPTSFSANIWKAPDWK